MTLIAWEDSGPAVTARLTAAALAWVEAISQRFGTAQCGGWYATAEEAAAIRAVGGEPARSILILVGLSPTPPATHP